MVSSFEYRRCVSVSRLYRPAGSRHVQEDAFIIPVPKQPQGDHRPSSYKILRESLSRAKVQAGCAGLTVCPGERQAL